MKNTFLIVIVSLLITTSVLSAQETIVTFKTPDGTDANSWSYKDYIIPNGMRLDSVYMGARRPGYAIAAMDFIFGYCPNATIYNPSTAIGFFNYQNVNTSLYNVWLRCDTSNKYVSGGIARVILPTNAGAIWDSVRFAISPIQLCYQTITVTDTLIINANLTGFNPITYQHTIKIYPNPTNDHITIDYGNYTSLAGYTLTIMNTLSQTVFTTSITQQTSSVNLSTWTGKGIYFVHLIDPQSNTVDIRKIVLQ